MSENLRNPAAAGGRESDGSLDAYPARVGLARVRTDRRRSRRSVGKEVLFSVADAGVGRRIDPHDEARGIGGGKSGLFPLPPTGIASLFRVRVECEDCGTSQSLSLARFAIQRLPVALWVPFKSYGHLMRCPGCSRITWLKVTLFDRGLRGSALERR